MRWLNFEFMNMTNTMRETRYKNDVRMPMETRRELGLGIDPISYRVNRRRCGGRGRRSLWSLVVPGVVLVALVVLDWMLTF